MRSLPRRRYENIKRSGFNIRPLRLYRGIRSAWPGPSVVHFGNRITAFPYAERFDALRIRRTSFIRSVGRTGEVIHARIKVSEILIKTHEEKRDFNINIEYTNSTRGI